ncbi:GMC oxidoreductase-domain-containing protein [Lentinula raphanica]|nr:GMC oxidoreductase-domain-containing protein [Lentinula raphanica]
MPQITMILLTLFFFFASTAGTLYQTADQLFTKGGAGGSVVANHLTENPNIRVLLIEAGSSEFDDLNIEVPSFASRLTGSQFDWNFTTLPQSGLNGRSINYARGFVLGGSTAINVMAYCRGSQDDYNRWAQVTGDEGWSWNSLQPYIHKIENLSSPADNHNITGEINSTIHGSGGPVSFTLPGQLLPTDELAIDASNELSNEFPFNLDYNSGNTIGLGWTQATIANGRRVTAASAYLVPAMLRPNLDILVNTQVTKILQSNIKDNLPVLKAVQFLSIGDKKIYILEAKKEVILSAGAVKTPHLLYLSGIGNLDHLSSLGLEVLVDNSDVGQNLQDHPLTTLSWTVNSSNTLDNIRTNMTLAQELLHKWNKSHTGPLTLGPGNQLAWLRLPNNSSILEHYPDPSAGNTSAHYEFIITDSFVSFSQSFPSEGNFFTLFSNLVSPSSRGNISLNSTDPFAHPLIQPNMLDTEFDIFTMREAIKAARRYMQANAWSHWIIEETSPSAKAQTDAEIETYIRNTCFTVNHVTYIAGKGNGALNPDLTVKGTLGLRVVDSSAFPLIPAAHTQVPTYILAERASDIIKNKYHSEVKKYSLKNIHLLLQYCISMYDYNQYLHV